MDHIVRVMHYCTVHQFKFSISTSIQSKPRLAAYSTSSRNFCTEWIYLGSNWVWTKTSS